VGTTESLCGAIIRCNRMDINTVAWIGAITGIIGTLTGGFALAWDIYKWRKSRINLRVTALPSLPRYAGLNARDAGKLFIQITVANRSDRRTTIIGVYLCGASSLWQRIRDQEEFWFFPSHLNEGSLPTTLEPGAIWTGCFEQDNRALEIGRDGRLYCRVLHSASDTPHTERIRL